MTATVLTRAQNIAIGGTAGRKRRRLEEERACNEKVIDSKVKYLHASAPAASHRELVAPAIGSSEPMQTLRSRSYVEIF